jgi:NTP pyrophosphatase (non-canonical NTP hydrolase)
MANNNVHVGLSEFIEQAVKTESKDFDLIAQRLAHHRTIRLLHGAFGLTEHAELLDMLKKHIFYGKPIDVVNLKEECGDILWYLAIIFDEMGWTFNEVGSFVISKLQQRYPDKFDASKAINRNVAAERTFMETVESTVEKVAKNLVSCSDCGSRTSHHSKIFVRTGQHPGGEVDGYFRDCNYAQKTEHDLCDKPLCDGK